MDARTQAADYPLSSARRRPWLPDARAAMLFVLAVYAVAPWPIHIGRQLELAVSIWFPNALLAAVLIRRPLQEWFAWCVLAGIGTVVSNLLHGVGPSLSMAFLLPNSAEALTAAVLLRRYCRGGLAFDRIGTPLALIFIAGISAPAVSAAVGAGLLHAARGIPWTQAAPVWFAGSAVGQLSLLPVALIASTGEWRRLVAMPARTAEFLLWAAFALGTTLLIGRVPTLFVLIGLPLLLAALRLPLFQSLVVNLLNTVLLGWLIGAGQFPLDWLNVGNEPLLGYLPVMLTIIPAFVLGAVQNVRDCERQALALSDARWKFALEGAEDGVWDWDVPKGSVFFSKQWKAMIGYAEDELADVYESWASHVHPDDLPRGLEAIRAHSEHRTPAYTFEHRLRCKDGTYKWILARGKVIEWNADGSPRRMIGTHTDITREHEAEAERRHLYERMTLAIKAGGIGVFEWNPHDRTIVCDERMCQMYGLRAEDDPTDPKTWARYIHPDDNARVRELLRLALRGQVSFDATYRIVAADGSLRHLKILGNVIRDGDGRAVRVVGCNWDISDRMLAEESLRRANERLRRSNEEVAQANQEVRNFAYIVSHDLRAPLVNIRGFAGELRYTFDDIRDALAQPDAQSCPQLRQRLSRLIDGDINEALDFIDSSVGRMGGLIEAILRLSRLGQQQMQEERIDLGALTKAILKSLHYDIEVAQGVVSLSPMPVVVADRSAMEQILGNLLSNAVKYRVSGRPLRISVSAAATEKEGLTIAVRDNGRGMAAEDIPRAFDLFRRVGVQDTVGEGMGLAYVQTLVRRYDGRITCESALGEGTSFTVSLPRVRPLPA
jgi:PAS domain S-box-containing protein